jgi:hypothetical protein
MIREYSAFLEAFQKGKMIKNAIAAKNIQLFSSAVGAFLIAVNIVATGFGYHIPLDDNTLNQVGAGMGSIYLFVNAILTVVSSEKVGLPIKANKK